MKQTEGKARDAEKAMGKIGDAGKRLGGMVAAGALAAGGALVGLAGKVLDTTGRIQDSADRAGTTAEEYQKWSFAAEQCGMTTETLEKAMIKQQKAFADAKTGSKTMSEAYGKLGIDMENVGSSSEAFDLVMKRLSGMKDESQRNAIANDIFGKSYAQLTPLLNEGAGGMDALKQKASDLGMVMSNESVSAGEQLGDTIDQVKGGLMGMANSIALTLLPYVQKAVGWVQENMPAIKETATGVFDAVKNGIKWVIDHANILIPILGGMLAGFIAFKVVTGFISIFTTLTTVIQGVSAAGGILNIIMAANPAVLIALAFAALVVAGIALYKNWDTVKEKAQELWEKVTGFFSNILDFVKNNWQGLLLLIVNPFAGAFKLVYDNNEAFRKKIDAFVQGIREVISNVFDKIKDIMVKPFEVASGAIKGIIDKIKSFLSFNWEFPKLKMPHFKVKGSINPIDWFKEGVPKLSVDWYAKGAIFNRPTIFNTSSGYKGVGEAGPEAITPISALMGFVRQAVSEGNGNLLEQLLSLLEYYLPMMSKMELVLDTGTMVGALAPAMDAELGNLYEGKERGR